MAAAGASETVRAIAAWVRGIVACQLSGHMEAALSELGLAERMFLESGDPHSAASVKVSTLIALAMLGRYDEAIACGLSARQVFLDHDDQLSIGKIEQNLGNLYLRRDRYEDAERFLRSARTRYSRLDDGQQLAMVENSLALTLTAQNRFREAGRLFEQALARTAAGGIEVTRAEIEEDLGRLALNQGDYVRALEFLERARRRFASLGLPHSSAGAEKQLADAYLELNLAPEAIAAYQRAQAVFVQLGFRADQAEALAASGRARALAGETASALEVLAEAREVYRAEGNLVGEATVTLAEAQVHHADRRFLQAAISAAAAEPPLVHAGTWNRVLLARWIRGDALRQAGDPAAHALLQATLRQACDQGLPQIQQRCETSLGLLAVACGAVEEAKAAFARAVELIEDLRAPLPAEEFRTAFVADKLVPYAELVRLSLTAEAPRGVRDAFGYVERARSRALVDLLGGALSSALHAEDRFEADLLEQLSELREDLSWLYSQINRYSERGDTAAHDRIASLHAQVRERETRVLELHRQLRQLGGGGLVRVQPLDVERLQREIGPDTVLVEYYVLDSEVLAFVVTDTAIQVVRGLTTEDRVDDVVSRLRFQLGALRAGSELVKGHLDQLASRTRHHLATLYDLLLRPIEDYLDRPRMVVVPYRSLHYVPFHALFDGEQYTIERHEISYAPSAGVLGHCLRSPARQPRRALLLGVPDPGIPRVVDELDAVAGLFEHSETLIGATATRDALRQGAQHADVVHLACHGQFRPDNPVFSALWLGDGWLTVRDAYELDLEGRLVTLSACETGASAIAPGDEVVGLVRGFLAAGAASLVVSFWTVDDAATAELMSHFYTRLQAGDAPGAALRAAQVRAVRDNLHPSYWAAFALFGRW